MPIRPTWEKYGQIMRIISGAVGKVFRRRILGQAEFSQAILLKKTLPVLAVFDGMGGESCGEIAAETAVREFGRFYGENKEKLKKSLKNFWKIYATA